MSRLFIRRFRSRGIAECEGCVLDPDFTREECREHVRRTGHVVRFAIEDVTVYESAPAGQMASVMAARETE